MEGSYWRSQLEAWAHNKIQSNQLRHASQGSKSNVNWVRLVHLVVTSLSHIMQYGWTKMNAVLDQLRVLIATASSVLVTDLCRFVLNPLIAIDCDKPMSTTKELHST